MEKQKVAVIQAGSFLFDTERSIEKAKALCGAAAGAGARLVVFPEAFIGGYPKGVDFGARMGSRSDQGRDDFRHYWEGAIEVPGRETSILAETAEKHRIHLVIGTIERESGTLYCTVLFFASNGKVEGKHRKLVPTAMERLIWGFGDGSTMPAVRTDFGILGAAICWENYMPLFRTAMYAKGVTLWCAPTVDDRDSWQATMQHIALEGRCFVLSACQYLERSQCPEDYHPIQGDAPQTVLIKGGSVIISPWAKFWQGRRP
jgi:nitrilase